MVKQITAGYIDIYNRVLNGHAVGNDLQEWHSVLAAMSNYVGSPVFCNVVEINGIGEYEYRGSFLTHPEAYRRLREFNQETHEFPAIVNFTILDYDLRDKEPEYDYYDLPSIDDLWEQPDYEELATRGIPYEVLFWRKSVRDALPDRPATVTGVENYEHFVRELKSTVDIARREKDMFSVEQWMQKKGYLEPAPFEGTDMHHYQPSEKLRNTGISVIGVSPKMKDLKKDGYMFGFLGKSLADYLIENGEMDASEKDVFQAMYKDFLTDLKAGVYGKNQIGVVLHLDLDPAIFEELAKRDGISAKAYNDMRKKEVVSICEKLSQLGGVQDIRILEKERLNGDDGAPTNRIDVLIEGVKTFPKRVVDSLQNHSDYKIVVGPLYEGQEKIYLKELKRDSSMKLIDQRLMNMILAPKNSEEYQKSSEEYLNQRNAQKMGGR